MTGAAIVQDCAIAQTPRIWGSQNHQTGDQQWCLTFFFRVIRPENDSIYACPCENGALKTVFTKGPVNANAGPASRDRHLSLVPSVIEDRRSVTNFYWDICNRH